MKKSKKNIISLSILILGLVSCATSISSSSSKGNESNISNVDSLVSNVDTTTESFDSTSIDVTPSNETSNQSSSSEDISSETPITISSSYTTQVLSSNGLSSSTSETSSKDIYYSSETVSNSSSEYISSSESINTSENINTSGNISSSSSKTSSSEMSSSSEEVIPEPAISFNGTYKGVLNDGDINYKINNSNIVTIEITDTYVKMNNLNTTIIEFDNYYGYKLSLNDKIFTLSYVETDEEKALTISLSDEDNDYYIETAYRIDQVVTIPSSYVGTFTGDLNDGDPEITLNGTNRLTVKITTSSITINNIKADLLTFDEYYGIELLLNGLKYYLVNDTYYEGVNVLSFNDDYNNYYCDLLVRNGFIIEE